MSKHNGDYIDWDNAFNYPIQWIQESEFARREYQWRIFRTTMAMEGKPSVNLYEQEMEGFLSSLEPDMREKFKNVCKRLPSGESFALSDAIDNRASQLSSGVDTYEYQVDDKYMVIDDDTEDRLAAACQQDYTRSHLGDFAATFSRDLDRAGLAAVLVKYDKECDTNEIIRINPKNTWVDTMYSATGCERFRGYSFMCDFDKLKHMIERDGDKLNENLEVPSTSILKDGKLYKSTVTNKKITTLNDLEIYIEDINKLACSSQLASSLSEYEYGEYDHDLRQCYNLNWYRTYATDPKQRTANGYGGKDVEVTVMYDMKRKIEFKIVNRRYVISANTKAFRREIPFEIQNPVTKTSKTKSKKIKDGCPLVFSYATPENRDLAPYPVSPVYKYLDVHDKLCALEAKRKHAVDILSVLRIMTSASDADSLGNAMNIMGVMIPDAQGVIEPLNLAAGYDWSVIDSQIMKYETEIKKGLHAYDEFDALQQMGDRASAAESGMAAGAIAQGLVNHQNAVMRMYSDIARQCIINRVLYSTDDTFIVNNRGRFTDVTIQELALNAVITVKSKLAIQAYRRTLAANAITLLGSVADRLDDEGQAYLISQAMYGNVSRREAQAFLLPPTVNEQAIENNKQEAQNTAMALQQNQAMYLQNSIPYEVQNTMENYSPEEVDQITNSLATNSTVPEPTAIAPQEDMAAATVASPELMELPGQPAGYNPDLEGMTPELAGEMVNANSMV